MGANIKSTSLLTDIGEVCGDRLFKSTVFGRGAAVPIGL